MPESNWKVLLREMYREQEQVAYPEFIGENHPLVLQTGMEPDVIENGVAVLKRNGWVEQNRFDLTLDGERVPDTFSLSKEGFEFAHEREMAQRRQRTNQSLVLLTVVLAVGSLLQVLLSMYTIDPSERLRAGFFVGVALLVVLWFFVDFWRSNR